MYIFILGKPGSGKTTLISPLTRDKDYYVFTTSDIFRSYIKMYDIDSHINNLLSTGILHSNKYIDHEIASMLFEHNTSQHVVDKNISSISSAKFIITDGHPRTAIQLTNVLSFRFANLYITELSIGNYVSKCKDMLFIFLNLNDEESIKRCDNRFICTACKHIHSNEHTRCVQCEAALNKRNDDNNLQAINMRLFEYNNETLYLKCLLEKYKFNVETIEVMNKTREEVRHEFNQIASLHYNRSVLHKDELKDLDVYATNLQSKEYEDDIENNDLD